MSDALSPCFGDPAFGLSTSPLRSGVRALAALVNEIAARMDTPVSSAPARQAAIETTPPSLPTRLTPRRGRSLRPAPGPTPAHRPSPSPSPSPPPPPGERDTGERSLPDPPEGNDDASEDTAEPDVDESHVETWRLVRLAQSGDGEAFGQLYDRYVDTVFRFIFFRVNDRSLAEDFTSETFLRALRRIGTISYQGRDIGAWFITIARNIVLDHMKSARHRLEITTADTIEGREHTESTESAVLETLQSERLMQAVDQLGAEQRECVLLRFIQGLSVSETATVMGKNDGAIKALQHRAVRKLAELVGQELR